MIISTELTLRQVFSHIQATYDTVCHFEIRIHSQFGHLVGDLEKVFRIHLGDPLKILVDEEKAVS